MERLLHYLTEESTGRLLSTSKKLKEARLPLLRKDLAEERRFFESLWRDRHMVREDYQETLLRLAPQLSPEESYQILQEAAVDDKLSLDQRIQILMALPLEDPWRNDRLRTLAGDPP